MTKLVNDKIVLLGAKSNALLPDMPAQYVYGVNGAVELASQYRSKFGSTIVGFVRVVELRKFTHIQESIVRSKPDELIVAGDDDDIENFIRNNLGITETKIYRISTHERLENMRVSMGWRVVLVALERIKDRGFKHFLRVALPDIILGRDKNWLSHSTGVDAIMYLMRCYPNKEIITAGISLMGGPHFNKVGEFTDKTANADQKTFKHWPLRFRKNVSTTDSNMHLLSNAPIWQGPSL